MTELTLPDADVHPVQAEGLSYRLWLPQASHDHIQASIATHGVPYELELLIASDAWLSTGATVVDVGANIGNHALYWAARGHRVECFEPDDALAHVARTSASLNGFDERVTVRTVALGAAEARGRNENEALANLGANRVVPDDDGDVRISTLDSFELDDVSLIKIDVEGMELEVLAGGRRTIERHRPILIVETLTRESLQQLLDTLSPLSYVHWGSYNASPTQVLVPSERLVDGQVVDRTAAAAIDRFDLVHERTEHRRTVNEISMRYRKLMAIATESKARVAELEEQLHRATVVEATLAHMTGAFEDVAARRAQAAGEAAELRETLHEVGAARQRDLTEQEEKRRLEQEALEHQMQARLAAAEHALLAATSERDDAVAEAAALRRAIGDRTRMARAAATRAAKASARLRARVAELETALDRAEHATIAALADRDAAVAEAAEESGRQQRLLTRVREELRRSQEAVRLRAADAHDLVDRVRDLERRAALARAHEADLDARIDALRTEKDQLRRRIADLRASVTYRSGAALRSSTSSARALLRLPQELLELRNEATTRQAEEADTEAPPESVSSRLDDAAVLPPITHGLVEGFEPPVRLDVPRVPLARPAGELRVACILDDFSYACFSPEGAFTQLTPSDWRRELTETQPDLLLVESAWRGKDGRWHNSVAQCGPDILGIIEWCKARGIPTVFWNKEDPVHFATFLNLASRFDTVLTTDIDRVPAYKEKLGHDRVHFLPFAAQPRIHNPIESFRRVEGVAFAGAYYARYPERTADLESFADALPDVLPLVIFDRMHGEDDPNYRFPDRYRERIAGRLEPSEIDIAYKGYAVGMNLNSVKSSQSMFARRVFELIACNTLVVSNFSPALRVIFGDLTIATDSGAEAARQLRSLLGTRDGVRRRRAQALRKVLREHLYEHRLASVAKYAGLEPQQREPRVAAVVTGPRAAMEHALTAIERQSSRPFEVVWIAPDGTTANDDGVRVVNATPASTMSLAELVPHATHIAVLHPDDHYGDDYLADLALAWRYADVDVVAKSGDAAPEQYVPADAVPTRRAMLRVSEATAPMPSASLTAPDGVIAGEPLQILVIDEFEYLRGGRASSTSALAERSSRSGPEGAPLSRLVEAAQVPYRAPVVTRAPGAGLDLASFASLFDSGSGPISIRRTPQGAVVRSDLPDGQHAYLWAAREVDVRDLGWESSGTLYVEASPGLNLQLAVVLFDESGTRLDHTMVAVNTNHRFSLPSGARSVKFALRARGSGRLTLTRAMPSEHVEANAGVITQAEHLVLTNIYPSYDDLYRNGFVHSRVKAYREEGLDVDVVRIVDVPVARSREFEGVRVIDMTKDDLARLLRAGSVRSVLVHFLDPMMWEVLQDASLGVRVHVWVHGSEVQPWWRREFNSTTRAQLERQKAASEDRMRFWRRVFGSLPDHVDFVFVSRYFADEVFEDVGIRLPEAQYRVIHNPIDGDLFTFEEKAPEQRLKVLTIRPYASPKYANDLSVAAVLALRDRPVFESLEFRFVGDGPLFDEILAPLQGLSNVTCERRFLSHQEIAALHKEYGVFLTPTRMDAQGVSRDEAMSSGLVPVTSAVAAVPEFVDERTGFLAPPEDHLGLAQGIESLALDPARFSTMSRAAAARVRAQSGKPVVLAQELDLIRAGHEHDDRSGGHGARDRPAGWHGTLGGDA